MEHVRFMVAAILVTSWMSGSVKSTELKGCKFRAIYNFGDSNSDTGTISAAIFPRQPPNGETFFHKPVGRIGDGRLIIDFIAEQLGLPLLNAYLDSIGSSFGHGANFASGGSTIVPQNKTIAESGLSPFPLNVQIFQFDQFKARTTLLYKAKKQNCCGRKQLPRPQDFAHALYTFDIGQNDLSYGFRTISDAQLVALIPSTITQLAIAIQHLYRDEGARTFWVHNTGPIGCLPSTLSGIRRAGDVIDEHGCVKSQNEIAMEFNRQLKAKVGALRTQLPLAAITYVDIYAAKFELLTNAQHHGFVDGRKICCGYHKNGVDAGCGQSLLVLNGTQIYGASCEEPSSYVSWDGLHYTEAANRWIANLLIANATLSDPPIPLAHACHRI